VIPGKKRGRAWEEWKFSSERPPRNEVLVAGHQDWHAAVERRRLCKYEAL